MLVFLWFFGPIIFLILTLLYGAIFGLHRIDWEHGPWYAKLYGVLILIPPALVFFAGYLYFVFGVTFF